MLELMNRHRRGILGSGIIVFCALLMLMMFGIGDMGFGNSSGNPKVAAKVNGQKIAYQNYDRAVRNISSRYQSQFGAAYEQIKDSIDIEKQAMDGLIAEKLMGDFIAKSELTASPKAVQKEIAKLPFFRNSGGLNQQTLSQFLAATGMTATALENNMKQSLVQSQLTGLLTDINFISEAESKAVFEHRNREAKFRFIKINGEDFADKVDITDEKSLAEFYEEKQEDFRKPKSAKYSFIKIDNKEFEKDVEVTDEDLELEYADQRQNGRFRVPAQLKLRQIVLKKPTLEKVPADADETAKKAIEKKNSAALKAVQDKAATIQSKLKEENADFTALVKQYSEDSPTKQRDGLRSLAPLKSLPPQLAQAVRSLDIGQHSETVDLPDGFYIARVEEQTEERVQPLSEVKPIVEQSFRASLAGEYASAAAEEHLNNWKANGEPLSEYAAKNSLTLFDSERLLSASEMPNNGVAGLSKSVIDYGEGKHLIDVTDFPFLVETSEVKDSYIPELAEIKDELVKRFTASKRVELAEARANSLLENLKSLKSESQKEGAKESLLSMLAKKEGLKTEETKKGTRTTVTGELFNSPDARRVLFTLSKERAHPEQVFQSGENFYICEFLESQLAEGSDFAKDKDDILTQEKNQAGMRLFQDLQENLKAKGELWINPELDKKTEVL